MLFVNNKRTGLLAFLVALPIAIIFFIFIFLKAQENITSVPEFKNQALQEEAFKQVKLKEVEAVNMPIGQAEAQFTQAQPELFLTQASINKAYITLEVARTDEETSKGLSGRGSMPENRGMLFVYSALGKNAHWMKDMRFPIDIIWLDNGYKIIGIAENVKPETYPISFFSKIDSRQVLETNAGFVEKNKVMLGDELKVIQD